MNNEMDTKEALSVTYWGIVVNLFLTAAKFTGGIFGRSSALVADGVHSLSDFVSDIVTIVGIKMSDRPIDETHDYGHGKFETIAIVIIGLILLIVSFFILRSGIEKVTDQFQGIIPEKPGWITLYITISSIVLKEMLYWVTIKKGKKLQSQALIANAWHHRSDSFSSVAALIGIGGALFFGPRWRILDPIAALVVAALIIVVAFKLIGSSLKELAEASLDEETEKQILEIIHGVDGVEMSHNLRTRKVGNTFAMDIHILVAGEMSVRDAHNIANEVENTLKRHYGREIMICLHVEPKAVRK